MKKTVLLLMMILLIFAVILAGCGLDDGEDNEDAAVPDGNEEVGEGENDEEGVNDEEEGNQEEGENDNAREPEEEVSGSYDYYPFIQNTRLHYDGEGSEYVAEKVHFDYIDEDRAQLRRQTGGTTLLEVIHYEEGKVYSLLQLEESYQRESFYEIGLADAENAEILIMDPIEAGTQWEVREGILREITNTEMVIETPLGEFEVIEVTTYEEDSTFTVYYGKDYGKVRSIFETGDTEIFTELVEAEEDFQVVEAVSFFYPEFDEDRLVYFKEEILFDTNDGVEGIFEEYFRRSPKEDSDEYTALISESTRINFIRLDRGDFAGHIDFSEEFITEMNAGGALESMILSSVVRTVGEYFTVDEVKLTIDGEAYASGHFEFTEGEILENTPNENEQEIEKGWE